MKKIAAAHGARVEIPTLSIWHMGCNTRYADQFSPGDFLPWMWRRKWIAASFQFFQESPWLAARNGAWLGALSYAFRPGLSFTGPDVTSAW
jgi:hypothetical protein